MTPQKSPIFSFYYFNFLGGHFVTKVSLLFWNQNKISDMTYFKETFSPLIRISFQIFRRKTQNKEKYLFSKGQIYILPIQNYTKPGNLKK